MRRAAAATAASRYPRPVSHLQSQASRFWAIMIPSSVTLITLLLITLALIILIGGNRLGAGLYRQESYSLATLLFVLVIVLLLIRSHL